MALHRDIYWVGKQWAVTGSGMQAVDQKRKGKFDIEVSRLWEDGLLESMQSLAWLNIEDFSKGLALARERFPESPRKSAPPKATIARVQDSNVAAPVKTKVVPRQESAAAAPPRPAAQQPVNRKFEMRIEAWPAKFVRPWRVRLRR
jgi:hypothetical protein